MRVPPGGRQYIPNRHAAARFCLEGAAGSGQKAIYADYAGINQAPLSASLPCRLELSGQRRLGLSGTMNRAACRRGFSILFARSPS